MSNRIIFWGNLTPLCICHWSVETLRVCLAFLQPCLLHLKNHSLIIWGVKGCGRVNSSSSLVFRALITLPFGSALQQPPWLQFLPFSLVSVKERCSQPSPGSLFGTCSPWLSRALSALRLVASPAPHLTCHLKAANTNLAINIYFISLG